MPRTEYDRAYDLTVSYSRGLRGYTVGGEVMAGQRRVRRQLQPHLGIHALRRRMGRRLRHGRNTTSAAADAVELFVDAGYNTYETTVTVDEFEPRPTSSGSGAHVGIGVRRAVSDRTDLGMRLELDRIDDAYMLAVRGVDYRYRLWGPLAVSAFLGAARYDLATPAYGYYFGAGITWRDVLPHFDIGIDARYADKVSRDKLLPTDPVFAQRNDIFYDVKSAVLYLSRKW